MESRAQTQRTTSVKKQCRFHGRWQALYLSCPVTITNCNLAVFAEAAICLFQEEFFD